MYAPTVFYKEKVQEGEDIYDKKHQQTLRYKDGVLVIPYQHYSHTTTFSLELSTYTILSLQS